MNKRGVSTLIITIGVLLLSLASASTLYAFGNKAAEGRVLDSRVLAEDLELTLNAACLDQNNLYAIYEINRNNYAINIQDRIITIRTVSDDKILLREKFSPEFCKNLDLNFFGYGFDEVVFSKSGDNLFVEPDFAYSEEPISLAEGVSENEFIWPSESKLITSCYGFRNIKYGSSFHEGVDIRSGVGEDVFAIADGKVLVADEYSGLASIDHGNGLVSKYLHLSNVFVKKDDLVKRGDVIANSGSKNTNDAHLDFRMSVNGEYIDPLSAGIYNPDDFEYKTSDVKQYDSNCNYNADKYAYGGSIIDNLEE